MKSKNAKIFSGVLFGLGIAGIFVSEIMTVRDTVKAKDILERHPVPKYDSVTLSVDKDENPVLKDFVKRKPTKYYPELVKTTWKAYIPTAASTVLTIGCLVGSKLIDIKTVSLLSSAAASGLALVGKYREKIADYANPEILHQIDKEVAKEQITKAKPPVISTSGLMSTETIDLSEDGEFLFFDPFTNMKFRTTKLAVLGAKYYLNRNFALGGNVPLSMFYAFLGLSLPEELNYCEWDCQMMCDDGYYWIDIDIVKSEEPDPETGEQYYIIEYGFDPGETEDSYYMYGNPIEREGSHAV